MQLISKFRYYWRSMRVLELLRWLVIQSARRFVFPQAKLSFADWGEDRVLTHMLPKAGYYVDVGCNDPVSNSNTWLLYTLGWRGLCIDGNATLVRAHQRIRPLDTAICALVSEVESQVTYTIFANSLVSSIDEGHVSRWKDGSEVVGVEKRWTRTLTSILDEFQAPNDFDLLSVDVEGHDLSVLKSLDLVRFRPRLIVVEIHGLDLMNAISDPICRLLTDRGYRLT